MKSITVKVNERDGLDARRVALLVQEASRYDARIFVSDGTRKMNAKSLMGMMALVTALGSEVTVIAEGSDEESAAAAVAEYIEGLHGSV